MPSYQAVLFRLSPRSTIEDLDVRFWYTEEGQRAPIEAKLREALALLRQHSPRQLRAIQRYLRGVLVTGVPAAAEYNYASRLCLLDCDAASSTEMSPTMLASTLVHEAMHARLASRGLRPRDLAERHRHENICLGAELSLASLLPEGHQLVAHIRAALAWPAEVYSHAARKARAADRMRVLGVPEWFVRLFIRFGWRQPSNEELKPTAPQSSLVE